MTKQALQTTETYYEKAKLRTVCHLIDDKISRSPLLAAAPFMRAVSLRDGFDFIFWR
jgi:hypothetical protein